MDKGIIVISDLINGFINEIISRFNFRFVYLAQF